jgi:hypothetical protein
MTRMGTYISRAREVFARDYCWRNSSSRYKLIILRKDELLHTHSFDVKLHRISNRPRATCLQGGPGRGFLCCDSKPDSFLTVPKNKPNQVTFTVVNMRPNTSFVWWVICKIPSGCLQTFRTMHAWFAAAGGKPVPESHGDRSSRGLYDLREGRVAPNGNPRSTSELKPGPTTAFQDWRLYWALLRLRRGCLNRTRVPLVDLAAPTRAGCTRYRSTFSVPKW